MSVVTLLHAVAATDRTLHREERNWAGKGLIRGGLLRFDAGAGEGATVEHILPHIFGGDNDLRHLGVAHRRCNGENRYAKLVERLRMERARRWRDVTP